MFFERKHPPNKLDCQMKVRHLRLLTGNAQWKARLSGVTVEVDPSDPGLGLRMTRHRTSVWQVSFWCPVRYLGLERNAASPNRSAFR